jgi:uroporphyrinogen-III synthase
MIRVLVLRAQADAERTAEKLVLRGFAPILSPVLEIAPTGARLPHERFDAAIVTSANAPTHATPEALALGLPLYVVGARTARAAEALGWHVAIVAEDAAALATEICARHAGSRGNFLYLAGRDRRNTLEAALRAAGHCVETVEVYAARAATALTQEAARAIAMGDVDSVLHYSRRSAEIFLSLVEGAGLSQKIVGARHFALSEEVAIPLSRLPDGAPEIAQRPDEEHLLNLLSRRMIIDRR